jgi:hypothetical protein
VSKRILLVEDEPGFVLTLTDSLTSEDYKVESERDSGAGFERASNETFDAIITSGAKLHLASMPNPAPLSGEHKDRWSRYLDARPPRSRQQGARQRPANATQKRV